MGQDGTDGIHGILGRGAGMFSRKERNNRREGKWGCLAGFGTVVGGLVVRTFTEFARVLGGGVGNLVVFIDPQ